MELGEFKTWLTINEKYSKETIGDIVSRMKRADNILLWFNDVVYQFKLEQEPAYQALSCSVRSQIKKAVKLYFQFKEQVPETGLANPKGVIT